MRRCLLIAGLSCACAVPGPKPAAQPPAAAPTAPAVAQIPPAANAANFELSAYEVVSTAEEDTPEYLQVYVDGQLRGRTETAVKSRPKLWRGELTEGNHPMRFEVWDSSDGISGMRRSDDLQPPERFFRIEPGQKTSVLLKLTDRGRQSLFGVTREPR